MSSDFKEVLRERVDALLKGRLAGVETAIEAARREVEAALDGVRDAVTAPLEKTGGAPALDQIAAEITAQIGQAAAESSRLSGDLALLRDSVVDIDGQGTQAEVLTALVDRASSFAPRVILFVVKGEDAIAWAARGFDDELGDAAVRGLSVSLKADTLLRAVVNGQTTFLGEPGDRRDDAVLLDRLGTTNPERIAGIPLRVRGKTVGILYSDSYDTSVSSISIEALELLVHSAGIIVELASLRQRIAEPTGRLGPAPAVEPAAAGEPEQPAPDEGAAGPAEPAESAPEEVDYDALDTTVSEPIEGAELEAAGVAPAEGEGVAAADEGTAPQPAAPQPAAEAAAFEAEPVESEASGAGAEAAEPGPPPESAAEPEIWVEPEPVGAHDAGEEPVPPMIEIATEPEPPEEPGAVGFDLAPEAPSFEVAEAEGEPRAEPEGAAVELAPELEPDERPTVNWATEAPAAAAVGTAERRQQPAPGEMGPEEEKLHSDARRFARLLVSEIKLYNEQQVAEGRHYNDLYERLKDDIDRSRQMYDKRVHAAVADRFDYFYDELVNTLAEGEPAKLGPDCPGPVV